MPGEVVGKGAYGVSYAARLIHVNTNTLKRWLEGYSYTYRGVEYTSAPRWEGQLGPGILGFLDLIEARMIGEFRRRGVKWNTIAAASDEAKEKLQVSHPFATRRLKTNGQRIFLEVGKGENDRALIELVSTNQIFESFVRPFLINLDYDEHEIATAWWPIGKEKEVIVDPARSFGKPIVNSGAVPTAVLAGALKTEGSVERVARWYEVSVDAVKYAAEFERGLAAA